MSVLLTRYCISLLDPEQVDCIEFSSQYILYPKKTYNYIITICILCIIEHLVFILLLGIFIVSYIEGTIVKIIECKM